MRNVGMALMVALMVTSVAVVVHARGGGGGGGGRGGGGAARGFSGGGRSAENFNRGGADRGDFEGRDNFEGDRAIGDRAIGDRAVGDNLNRATGANRPGQTAQQFLGVRNDLPAPSARRTQVQAHYGANNRPFTNDWYRDHPNAWRYRNADAWGLATFAGAAAWLGWDAVADENYATYYAQTPSDEVTQQADTLASNGSQEVSNDGEWFSLGTYAMAASNQADATVMLNLAVNKDGILRGNYYDLVSNTEQLINGSIDKTTQLAAWRVGVNSKVTFQTTLADLTAASTPVSLQMENGKSILWNMVRATQPLAAK